jgi:hypothetical protein
MALGQSTPPATEEHHGQRPTDWAAGNAKLAQEMLVRPPATDADVDAVVCIQIGDLGRQRYVVVGAVWRYDPL